MIFHTPLARFAIATAAVAWSTLACQSQQAQASSPVATKLQLAASSAAVDSPAAYGKPLTPPPVSAEEQNAFLNQAAQAAWSYIRRNYQPTGLVVAHETYQFVTVWDIASALSGYYAAHQLGLTTDADYHERMTRALETLRTVPLYDDAGFNKLYDAKSGAMIGRNEQRTSNGYGWSTLDTGRLLIWLKIIEQSDPSLAPAVQQVVSRLSLKKMVHDGYLQGRDIDLRTGHPGNYQEGRLGYEQYSAEGFAAWGQDAKRALDFGANGRVVTANGYTLPADKRGGDLLTSEPFIMMGMELGWRTPDWQKYARMVFDAQQQRFQTTGVMTMTSEDAIPEPPAYFYYYLLYRDGKTFVVTTPSGDAAPSNVRWVSAKAAFGWHALLPSDFTWQALQTVRNAEAANRGWTAGVFESNKESTHSFNLNTAAIVLESVAYARRHCPFIQTACGGAAGPGH